MRDKGNRGSDDGVQKGTDNGIGMETVVEKPTKKAVARSGGLMKRVKREVFRRRRRDRVEAGQFKLTDTGRVDLATKNQLWSETETCMDAIRLWEDLTGYLTE